MDTSHVEHTLKPIPLEKVVWIDPERMSGAPCFTGTRVPIKNLFDYLEGGDTLDSFLEGFPGVSREQAIRALEVGKERLLNSSNIL